MPGGFGYELAGGRFSGGVCHFEFPVAGVSRPLMSVAKVCAEGHTCIFTRDGARVVDEQQKTIAQFKQQNGLYI